MKFETFTLPDRILEANKKRGGDCWKFLAIALSHSGHIIAASSNAKGSGIVSKLSIHAEEFLIKKLLKIKAWHRFKGIQIVVLRNSYSKGWHQVKPCSKCRTYLSNFDIKY